MKSVLPALLAVAMGGALDTASAQAGPGLTIGPAQQASNFKITWSSLQEKTYRLWESPDLTTWTVVTGYPRAGTGVEMEDRFAPGAGHRYFRLSAEDTAPAGFALIPAGNFEMGDTSPGAMGDDQELPHHTVYVDAFYMNKYEVTWTLWDTVRTWGATRGYAGLPAGGNKGTNHPVYSVAWDDVVRWCNACSEMEGLTPCYYVGGQVMRQPSGVPEFNRMANGYRLPTEAEWEKAARGGTTGTNFSWGNTITHSNANYNSYGSFAYDLEPFPRGPHPDYDNGTSPYTAPVGSFAPNGYGLYDVAGNVGERCWDWHNATYYSGSPSSNPTGPVSGTSRLIRGGSWGQSASYSRCSARFYAIPGSTGPDAGFRLARNREASPAGFTRIGTGSFSMGDQSNPKIGLAFELPVHTVSISACFIAKNEVPGSEWDTVRTWGLGHGYTDLPVGAAKSPNHPVHSVSWHDAVKWCNACSEMRGLGPCYRVAAETYRTGLAAPVCDWTENGYRLPTEAEWERAARGGLTGKNFPWGGATIQHRQANYLSSASWDFDVSSSRGYHPVFSYGATPYTSPLGSFAANDYGLNDMAGNVREWCWDWADQAYYASSPGTDPRGPASGTLRALRGGAWSSEAIECRSSARFGTAPNTRSGDTGFRVVLGVVAAG